jgi:GT2 family glycosyltransferase
MDTPAVTVVVPTRGRSAYLEVTLDSLLRQRTRTPHEILVVDDGSTDATREVAERAGVRCVSHGERRSLNAARNTGIREAGAPLVALVDDDVVAPPGWLDALARGAERNPDAEAFGGPIRARFEGGGPRSCGREDPPVTTLDLGPDDREAEMVWGANLAVRRSAVERVGWFDELIVRPHGDEEEWLERLRAAGGRIVYLADAGLDHRRTASDSRLAPLARAAFARGRGARASDRRRGRAPGLGGELRVLIGCGWHTLRRACPQGVIMGAHSAGRIAEALRTQDVTPAEPDSFLSGDAGDVSAPWRRVKRTLGEAAFDLADLAARTRPEADRLAERQPPLRVLVLGVYRPGSQIADAVPALTSERHHVRIVLASTQEPDPRLGDLTVATGLTGGKFENLNRLLALHAGGNDPDWTLIVDDDVELPDRFLDRFVALCEAFDLQLAQPAQTLRSHSAWKVVRRRPASLVRETRFVEIGPVTGFRREASTELLPFPELRFGWGLDLHWAALAAERGWRLGVVDALPVRHEAALVASGYSRTDAIDEARQFLAERRYLTGSAADEVVAVHRRAR